MASDKAHPVLGAGTGIVGGRIVLLGAAGGMYVAEEPHLPYDARVEYLAPVYGEEGYFDTGFSSADSNVLVTVVFCRLNGTGYGALCGSGGSSGNQLYMSGATCRMGDGAYSFIDFSSAAGEVVTIVIDAARAGIIYKGSFLTGTGTVPPSFSPTLCIFAQGNASSGVTSGSFARYMRLYELKIEQNISGGGTPEYVVIHDFVPVRITVPADGVYYSEPFVSGALYDMQNPSGGPNRNGMYYPVSNVHPMYACKVDVGTDVVQSS